MADWRNSRWRVAVKQIALYEGTAMPCIAACIAAGWEMGPHLNSLAIGSCDNITGPHALPIDHVLAGGGDNVNLPSSHPSSRHCPSCKPSFIRSLSSPLNKFAFSRLLVGKAAQVHMPCSNGQVAPDTLLALSALKAGSTAVSQPACTVYDSSGQ